MRPGAAPEEEPPQPEEEEQDDDQEQEQEQEQDEQQQEDNDDESSGKDEQEQEQEPEDEPQDDEETDNEPDSSQGKFKSIPKAFETGEAFQVMDFSHEKDRKTRKGSGRRTQTKTTSTSGRYIYPTMNRRNNDLALDATIRAAAPFQKKREDNGMKIVIKNEDIREKVRQKKISNLLVFVVDASGSMGNAGIEKGLRVIENQLRQNPDVMPLLIVITDGRGNISIDSSKKPAQELMDIGEMVSKEKRLETMVIDIENNSMTSFGIAGKLAAAMKAKYYRLDEIKGSNIEMIVRREKAQ